MSDKSRELIIGVALFLGLILTLYVFLRVPPVDSRVFMANGTRVVMFVTSDKVEERLKDLRRR